METTDKQVEKAEANRYEYEQKWVKKVHKKLPN